ncbi:MAG: FHA domain-containing protein [Anaerolineae bacterium]
MDDRTVVAAGQPSARLVVRQGVQVGKVFSLGRRPVVLGRDEKADVLLPDPEVSRLHARVGWFETQYVIEDLRSTNGTYLNGVLLRTPKPLNHGDKIALGQTVLEFEWLAGASPYPAVAEPQPHPAEQPYPPLAVPSQVATQPPSPMPSVAPSPPAVPTTQEEASSGTGRCLLVGCGCLVLLTLLFAGAFVLVWFAAPEWMQELQNLLDQYHIPLQLTTVLTDHMLF